MKILFWLLACLLAQTSGFQPLSVVGLRHRPCLPGQVSSKALQSPSHGIKQDNFVLQASSLSSEEVPSIKKALLAEYKFMRLAYASVGIFLFALGIRFDNLATLVGGASGFGIASGLSHILAGATENDRLGSDTYQRLNLALLGFCGIGLLAVPAEAGFIRFQGIRLLAMLGIQFVKGLGAYVAYAGWRQGVGKEKNFIDETVQGLMKSLRSLRVNKNRGAIYANFVLAQLMAFCYKFGALSVSIEEKHSLFSTSLLVSAVSRLFMISTMFYTLKDAGDRGRLTGTTFIQMTWMLSLWFLAVGAAQSLHTGQFVFKYAKMWAFAPPLAVEAFRSQLIKAGKLKSKDKQ